MIKSKFFNFECSKDFSCELIFEEARFGDLAKFDRKCGTIEGLYFCMHDLSTLLENYQRQKLENRKLTTNRSALRSDKEVG